MITSHPAIDLAPLLPLLSAQKQKNNTCLDRLCPTTNTTADTHQVIDAQEEGLDAPIALAIPAGCDAQVYPHQLRQELQGETAQAVFRAPVQLKQLVAHGLQ